MVDLVVVGGVQYKRATAERLGLLEKAKPEPGAPRSNKTRDAGTVRRGNQQNATPPVSGE